MPWGDPRDTHTSTNSKGVGYDTYRNLSEWANNVVVGDLLLSSRASSPPGLIWYCGARDLSNTQSDIPTRYSPGVLPLQRVAGLHQKICCIFGRSFQLGRTTAL